MSQSKRPIGKIIRELREKSKLSQEELGERAGIHRTYVSQLERGVKSPTLTILEQIAEALSTKASTIVRMTEE